MIATLEVLTGIVTADARYHELDLHLIQHDIQLNLHFGQRG